MKIAAKLVLAVVYDDGGDDNFDADSCLRSLVHHAVSNGLLTDDCSPATVDTWDIDISVEEQEGKEEDHG